MDALSFSTQFYFMSSVHAWGMIFLVLGVTIMIRKEYVMLSDVMFGLILLVMWLLGMLLKWTMIRMANAVSLWKLVKTEGTVDDEIAARLAIGEGGDEELERERVELRALNSPRFRHKWLERNRPWLVQHLVELLTPRSLDML